MSYSAPLYRPPSEADSLILQLTHGCSHNQCVFCYMYKNKPYRVKTWQEMQAHIAWGKTIGIDAKRIFLADGNVLALSTETLLSLLQTLYQEFPQLERVSLYGGPRDILAKRPAELYALSAAGLKLVYLGVESGSARVLARMKKGVNPAEMIEAGGRVREAGIPLSCMLISGLGGSELWQEHALESARVINGINPEYLALLTLLVEANTPLYQKVNSGEFSLLAPEKILAETYLLLDSLTLSACTFRSNHPSNYFSLAGVLNRDKGLLLRQIRQVQAEDLRPEDWRAL
ncbi:MAG: radical SAM protein [Firmicutes bacterium]|nr:radical SAM protein [Bacillota bacterium]